MSHKLNEEIVRLFWDRAKRAGMLYTMSLKDGENAIGTLNNANLFDPNCLTKLPRQPKRDDLLQLLLSLGAGEQVYLVSGVEELDGQIKPLRETLGDLIGRTSGTFAYCFEGQVGYYEVDGFENFYIVHRSGRKIEVPANFCKPKKRR